MNDWRHTKRMIRGSNGNVAWIDTTTPADKERQARQDAWQSVFDALPIEKKEAFQCLSKDERERLYKLNAAEFAAHMEAI